MDIALILAKVFSPKGIMTLVVITAISLGLFSLIHFIHDYGEVQKQNAVLLLNEQTLKEAMAEQQHQAEVQHNIDLETIKTIKEISDDHARMLQQTQDDYAAMQALGIPTNADNKCSASPYIHTQLDRMRKRHPTNNNSNPTGNARKAG